MITYNGIITYFKEFASKHVQINSFTEGGVDKMDLKKINNYPVLHVDITGSEIQDNIIIYNLDVYIITGITDDNTDSRRDALADTLLIMQDLRSEFFKGKYIVAPSLLLRGDESISCTPIEEDFNNRVYGWSTSISVTGVNESTICNIPYPKGVLGQNILERWDGGDFVQPFDELYFFSNFYWWSATESVQGNLIYSGTKLSRWDARQNSNWLGNTYLLSNYSIQTDGIKYNEDAQAIRLKGDGDAYWFHNGITTTTEYYYYFALKVKNIKSLDKENTSLFQIYPNVQSGADGIKVFIGSPTSTNEDIRNRICLSNWDESTIKIGEDISDGSADYIREKSLAFGLEIGGDDAGHGVKLMLDGEILLSQVISTSELTNVIIGNNKVGSDDTASFDVQEVYAKQFDDDTVRTSYFVDFMIWLKYRRGNNG